MPAPALLLLAATLLPLAAFALLLFTGRRLGAPLAGWVATVFAAAAFTSSIAAMIAWFQGGHYPEGDWGKGQLPIYLAAKWLPIGGAAPHGGSGIGQDHIGYLDIGIYVDSLTILMFAMVTLLGLLGCAFGIGYMRREGGYGKFFAYAALLTFATLGMAIGGTLLHLFVFWGIGGLATYLLVGFWEDRPSAARAAVKTALAQRIGDTAFLVGVGILLGAVGNLSLPDLWSYLMPGAAGQVSPLPGGGSLGPGLLTLAGALLVLGAAARSAQFPLHFWLADSAEAPAPAAALIQSVATVVVGVYAVARLYPILTPGAKLLLAILGATTLTMGALVALVQRDLRRVLTFSTISQFGLIMLAMGIGSWIGGLMHLFAHAFFKPLLILGAGSVVYAARQSTDLEAMGGLARKLPVTAVVCAIAVLAMAGTPFLSGFYSSSTILSDAGAFASIATRAGRSSAYWLLFVLPAVGVYLTAFYGGRWWMLVFAGTTRDRPAFERARERTSLWFPLVVLAVGSIGGGRYFNVQPLLESAAMEMDAIVRDVQSKDDFFRGRAFSAPLARAWPDTTATSSAGEALDGATAPRARWTRWAFAIGIALAALIYSRGLLIPRQLLRFTPLRWLHAWLSHAMYFDELYASVFVSTTLALSWLCAWLDRRIINGIAARSVRLVRRLSAAMAFPDARVVKGAAIGINRMARRRKSTGEGPDSPAGGDR